MDSTTGNRKIKDRPLDPAKVPATAEARQLVEEALARLATAERRIRKRQAVAEKIYTDASTALVSDLAYRWLREPGGWLTVEMSKADLAPGARRAPFMTEQLRELVRLMAQESVGILDFRLGHRSAAQSIRSTIRAGSWLCDRLNDLELSLADIGRREDLMGDSLTLRGPKVNGKSVDLPIPQSEVVAQLRLEMSEVNAWLAQAELAYVGDPEEDRVDVGDRYMRRIFNEGRFDRGGRLNGGFWQSLNRERRRQYVRIEGQPVAFVDFAQLSVRLAYAHAGKSPPEGDLYFVPGVGGKRDGVKKVMNALLASDKVPTRMPQGTREYFPSTVKIAEVIEGICRQHPDLVRHFGSSQSGIHQNIESRVIIDALLRLKGLGIVSLPVHDCLIVRWDRAGVAKEVMEQSFERVSGGRGKADIELAPLAQVLAMQLSVAP